MKLFRKVLMVVLTLALVFIAVACGGGGDDPDVVIIPTTGLKPSDITQLADLTNYSTKESYYASSAVSYSSVTTEEAKLSARITDKLEDPDYEDFSSVVKIFAHSDASAIIQAMSAAALPNAKMTLVVNYLAGEAVVTENDITAKVASGTWSSTANWSFFDDYDYYEKLQDRADLDIATDTDADNVKRQYRNIAGKIFAIGMTGDEFARTLVKEMFYAITVVESTEMSGAALADTVFWNYCKTELDYDTLVYFLAFNDYYSEGSTGLAKSVQLYGYYYDYEKNSYDTTTDDEFEKSLTYSHKTTFTTAEWLEYVDIQRSTYTQSYRYSDNFYVSFFYAAHLAFEYKKENRENEVYGITTHNSTLYTEELQKGLQNGNLAGQLKMTDWLWCYSGDDAVMTTYNDANTKYETGKNQGAEVSAEGEFYYDKEQLKINYYLLNNMTSTELGCTLRYQIYNYSSDMISSIQANKKSITLLTNDITEPDDYIISNGYAITATEAKNYAMGKLDAFNDQMATSLASASVETKATNAASESWETMKAEIATALDDAQYTSITTYVKKLERLEDLVIKMKWSDGSELDDYSTSDHAEDTKVYDTTHAISKFADKYATILQHVSGQSVITFKNLSSENYTMVTGTVDTWYAPEYYAIANNANENSTTEYEILTTTMLADSNKYSEYEEITIESGLGFKAGIIDAGENTWWNDKSRPGKNSASVSEKAAGSNITTTYTYTYTFVGWYLDAGLLYKLEETDEINCDLILYAGYLVKKTA